MTTGVTTERAIRQNLLSLHPPGLPSWIPAFAGMTTGGAQWVCGYPDSPFAIAGKCLTPALTVIYGHAYPFPFTVTIMYSQIVLNKEPHNDRSERL